MSPNLDTYNEVTARILAELEKGTVPWRKPWRTAFPESLAGRPYRGINVLLLQLTSDLQGYGDHRWGTYRAVKNAGGNVRRGEKGTRVILWKPVSSRARDEAGELEDRSYLLLRSYTVFNAAQCDGLEPLEPFGDAFVPQDRAEEVFEGMPNRPQVLEGCSAASFSPAEDIVRLPARDSFETPAGFYATAFHELTHAAGVESRAGGLEPASFGTDPYAREELTAEVGASMLAGYCQLEGYEVSSTAAYLEAWRKRLEDDPKLIVKAAAAAQRRADYILGVSFEEKPAEEKPAALVAA